MEPDASQDGNQPMHESDLVADEAVDEVRPFISPQDFYREGVQREDIRRILAALAK